MLSYRAILLAFLAISSTSIIAQPAERPYAPDLYDRRALEEQPKHAKRSLGDDSRPYSPDLYFRRALTTDEMNEKVKRSAIVEPTKTFGKRSLCRRDADCGSGFCGNHGACLEKRGNGAQCKDSANACSDGHFCSTVNFRCQQKRSLGGSCRHDQGCSQGLQCLNYKCIESSIQEGVQDFQDKFQEWSKTSPWGSSASGSAHSPKFLKRGSFESGSPHSPKVFNKRAPGDQGDNNDNDEDPLGDLFDQLGEIPSDVESWLSPKASGSAGHKKILQWTQ